MSMRETTNDTKAGKLTKLQKEVYPNKSAPALLKLDLLPGAINIALARQMTLVVKTVRPQRKPYSVTLLTQWHL